MLYFKAITLLKDASNKHFGAGILEPKWLVKTSDLDESDSSMLGKKNISSQMVGLDGGLLVGGFFPPI